MTPNYHEWLVIKRFGSCRGHRRIWIVWTKQKLLILGYAIVRPVFFVILTVAKSKSDCNLHRHHKPPKEHLFSVACACMILLRKRLGIFCVGLIGISQRSIWAAHPRKLSKRTPALSVAIYFFWLCIQHRCSEICEENTTFSSVSSFTKIVTIQILLQRPRSKTFSLTYVFSMNVFAYHVLS